MEFKIKQRYGTKGKDIRDFLTSMKKDESKAKIEPDNNDSNNSITDIIKDKAAQVIDYMNEFFHERLEFLKIHLEKAMLDARENELDITNKKDEKRFINDRLYEIIYVNYCIIIGFNSL